MTDEGELHKRRKNLFDAFNSGQIDERELERHLNADSDEATKDFPLTTYGDNLGTVDGCIQLINRRSRWFKKWHGDSS